MIYFDHAATTPIAPKVLKAMEPYFSEKFGNPSSIYRIGREAKSILEEARKTAADILGAESPMEIVFTSGATESSNLGIKGAMEAAAFETGSRVHVLTTAIEHHSVLDTVKHLEKSFGAETTFLSVTREGLADPKDLSKAIKDNTAVISVMSGNNEMGALQPIEEIAQIIELEKERRKKQGIETPLVFHVDAVQSFAFKKISLKDLPIDMLSLTAHKFYGPKGVGLLYVRQGTKFNSQQKGGAQEKGRRAGTENVPYIVGMVKAMQIADEKRDKYSKKITSFTNYLVEKVTAEIQNVELIGPKSNQSRLPHIATFLFKGVEGESVLLNLDMLDIAASSGSACTSGSLEPSHVTKAMGYDDLSAHGAVRFSLGELNKKSDIDKLMENLPGIIDKLRAMSPVKG